MFYLDYVVFALKIVGWLAVSYAFISFVEFQIHRHLMHRKRLPKWVYRVSAYILETFEAHAIRHHGIWYKEFDYEPDPQGREFNLDITLSETLVMIVCLSPVLGLFLWFFPWGCAVLLGVTLLHNQLWNLLHRQMHIPKDVFFRDWKLFHYLARHHFMHHRQTNRNYNVVFPLFDYIFRSVAKPELGDVREMLRLGYLQPKTDRGRVHLEKWRREVALHRANAA